MSYVHTLKANYPPPRIDGVPFVTARWDEASSEHGTYSPIQTFPLIPVDPNPLVPLARDFTVTEASGPEVWLRLTWIDGTGDLAQNDPIFTKADPITIASVADVRRNLKLAPGKIVTDEDLAWYLSVVWSYLSTKLPDYNDVSGTEVHYNVLRGDVLFLPQPDASVTAVRSYNYQGAAATPLIAGQQWALDDGAVRLFPTQEFYWPTEMPADTITQRYAKVEIDWVGSSAVPYAVREAVALAAAGMYTLNPTLAKGMRSERIGSYSYTLSDKDVEGAIPLRAMQMLKPFMRKRRVFVT